ncbi:hypothetical protein GUJ93_ZPchr0006g44850 [Zizania palustris]|uniref:Cystatin domain-containing protein n=1 Tax=Zizania palustris TaxID=103762 RepID=A0A8J5W3P3_ZIZPA|nr:hypothetical protein GUJ93_ZPchr0006g44850 [Zizania palustris]
MTASFVVRPFYCSRLLATMPRSPRGKCQSQWVSTSHRLAEVQASFYHCISPFQYPDACRGSKSAGDQPFACAHAVRDKLSTTAVDKPFVCVNTIRDKLPATTGDQPFVCGVNTIRDKLSATTGDCWPLACANTIGDKLSAATGDKPFACANAIRDKLSATAGDKPSYSTSVSAAAIGDKLSTTTTDDRQPSASTATIGDELTTTTTGVRQPSATATAVGDKIISPATAGLVYVNVMSGQTQPYNGGSNYQLVITVAGGGKTSLYNAFVWGVLGTTTWQLRSFKLNN